MRNNVEMLEDIIRRKDAQKRYLTKTYNKSDELCQEIHNSTFVSSDSSWSFKKENQLMFIWATKKKESNK